MEGGERLVEVVVDDLVLVEVDPFEDGLVEFAAVVVAGLPVQQLEARQRSAETRRRRTREALISAARDRFAELGWQATRIEDVAKDAGVGVATAFSHFSKQALLGHAYAPIVEPLLRRAQDDVAAESDPIEALKRHVRELARVSRTHQKLTIALLAAVHEQTISADGLPEPGDMSDVRAIVPMPQPMIELVTYGQKAGTFRPAPPGADVGAYHTNALLLRVMTRPRESASATTELVLSQMLLGLLKVTDANEDEQAHLRP